MQTTEQIAAILNALKAGQTVTVKYVHPNGTMSGPAELSVSMNVNRIDGGVIFANPNGGHMAEARMWACNGQYLIHIAYGEGHVITGAESSYGK